MLYQAQTIFLKEPKPKRELNLGNSQVAEKIILSEQDKTLIEIYIDNDILQALPKKSNVSEDDVNTIINQALREYLNLPID